jgi:hypothetical protein
MSDKIVQLSDASFEADVINADSPFWSISGPNGVDRAR